MLYSRIRSAVMKIIHMESYFIVTHAKSGQLLTEMLLTLYILVVSSTCCDVAVKNRFIYLKTCSRGPCNPMSVSLLVMLMLMIPITAFSSLEEAC